MRKIVTLIALFFPFMVLSAPVDGYKDLKFGMPLEDVKNNNKLCESVWRIPADDNPIKVAAGFMICDKFAFNTSYIEVTLRFIGNKLQFIELSLPKYPMYPKNELVTLLTQKYGEPVVTKEDLLEGKKKKNKNESLVVEEYKFADGTVSLNVYHNNGKDEPATIYYRSLEFINAPEGWSDDLSNKFLLEEL
ncbi:hypothetical protein ROV65_03265 [Pasteurella multocida]|uniref:hypothetical protein n=1 Tax=Pasteurella multocida TaxID=747 RepID=UPI002B566DDA|nr:hypothetical protein [Pasteurella multocida]MEB3496505.1 hypothetical protein [Pasteurella multocida]